MKPRKQPKHERICPRCDFEYSFMRCRISGSEKGVAWSRCLNCVENDFSPLPIHTLFTVD